MQNKNIVVGIEGLVGSGKTSISKELLKYIPNSILIHGGDIYRAIVYGIMNSKTDLNQLTENMRNTDVMQTMKELNLEIKLENKETVVYIGEKKINNEDLQSEKSSMAVSMVSNVADNSKLYEFGKQLIDNFRKNHNVILSSRDIVKMYSDVTYHFFITASLNERINRKYIQYNGEVSKERIEKVIKTRDELQSKSGYYNLYSNTQVIDVTTCKSIEEASKKVLSYIKIEVAI